MLNRRDFLKTAAATGVGLAVATEQVFPRSSRKTPTPKAKENVSIAVIGVGNRGRHLLRLAAVQPGVKIGAICDVNPKAIEEAQKVLAQNGYQAGSVPVYTGGEYAYRDLLKRDDIDGVIVATNWDWHMPVALDTMRANKYLGLEVPGARTVEECWELVNTHEETGTNMMLLENCCYDRECMAVLKMLREGIFGIPMHATCGYRHSAWGSPKWLQPVDVKTTTEHFVKYAALRNADQYPTHGIGPVANWLDINCGNRFLYLTSVATKAKTINEYVKNHPQGGPDHPNASYNFKQGDIVTTTIKTYRGETIIVNYDNYLPRPYSRDYSLQGTNGIWEGLYRSRGIYIEGKSPKHHQWEKGDEYDKYMKEYDHPVWKDHYEKAQNAGHGGIDYFTIKDFVTCVKGNLYPPIDVYDAATWSVIIPLSERSIANGSTPEFFPDFTRGKWETREPYFGV
ncbi:Gfo/Idh/MocA family oxidoreductase [Proteiniphilum sp. X52]|uniref:Gfo/Idh/MocA family oxidoreductase n=1 Tax=Proteiniphilum sp. X52 TaxID=2382159 RepID=UPI000F09F4B6|nr:Gfo/Idh/MocA family oxidoreductase [Proteiniphilum sp. X52]RNC66797.1 twin-arginine translocation signal domain-containing protein [Proteiniphilum sp. X52]